MDTGSHTDRDRNGDDLTCRSISPPWEPAEWAQSTMTAPHKAQQKKHQKQKRRMARQEKEAARTKRRAEIFEAGHPLKNIAVYSTGETYFGEAISPEFLVARIASYEWRESLIALARLAAIVANDEAGALSPEALRLTREGLHGLTASTPAAHAMLQRGRKFWARSPNSVVVAHEAALNLLMHTVILYGGTSGGTPTNSEIQLWLLGAGDQLHGWKEPDNQPLDSTASLAAEMVKVSRFNRSSVDHLSSLLRSRGLFSQRPPQGPLAKPAAWEDLQSTAFTRNFEEYFATFVLPLYVRTLRWGQPDYNPVVSKAMLLGELGQAAANDLARLTSTRAVLSEQIKKRMASSDLLPHAPTALLHTPFVDLENEDQLVASSPWYIRNVHNTGIWTRFNQAAKEKKFADDVWPSAFGHMFELWCAAYARRALPGTQPELRLLIPESPGSADEIEDVVLIEDGTIILFSVKARLVREPIARHAISKKNLVEWYEQYFFAAATERHRKGVVAQLSARIEMLRNGDFSPRIERDAPICPVLVTFDTLCDNQMLSAWLVERCKHHNLLQQSNVGPLALASVEDYERLMAAPSQGHSIANLLHMRSTKRWKNESLERILSTHEITGRLPDSEKEFNRICSEAIAAIQDHATKPPKS